MNNWHSHREFFLAALILHMLLIIGLIWEHTSDFVAMQKDSGQAALLLEARPTEQNKQRKQPKKKPKQPAKHTTKQRTQHHAKQQK